MYVYLDIIQSSHVDYWFAEQWCDDGATGNWEIIFKLYVLSDGEVSLVWSTLYVETFAGEAMGSNLLECKNDPLKPKDFTVRYMML